MKRTKGWRSTIEVHPAAELFPLLPPEELRVMADSIAKQPFQVPDLMPIIHAERLNPESEAGGMYAKWKFTLLDGRNRLDATRRRRARIHGPGTGRIWPDGERREGLRIPGQRMGDRAGV